MIETNCETVIKALLSYPGSISWFKLTRDLGQFLLNVKFISVSFCFRQQAVLNSMHKYIPRIHIVRADDLMKVNFCEYVTFSFCEAEFIAVTAYQNEQVSSLWICLYLSFSIWVEGFWLILAVDSWFASKLVTMQHDANPWVDKDHNIMPVLRKWMFFFNSQAST